MGWLRSSSWIVPWVACGIIGCSTPAAPRGDLLGESYQLIDRFYIQPVQTSTVGEASLAALTQLDRDIVVEVNGSDLVLKRRAHALGHYRLPPVGDSLAWGETAAQVTAAAAAASPTISQVPDGELDRILIDGAVAALDRFSHYLPPEEAVQSAIIEDGPGEPTVTPARSGQGADGFKLSRQSSAISSAGHPSRAPSVQLRMDGGIAVVRVLRFTTSTGPRLRHALARVFDTAGARPQGVILDLRDDPGGQIAAAVDIADLFLAQGIVVALEGRDPRDRRVFRAGADGGVYETIPLAVLVNGRSISSAEVLSAALQDNHRAIVIGTSTFGKGTAQRIVPLANGGELWVTSSYMRASAGYLLQHHGVIPDICTRPAPGDRTALLERFRVLMSRPRASLSEVEWGELRQICPASSVSSTGDGELAVAEQIVRRQAR